MKKSSSKSRTSTLALSMATIILVSPSCKSLDPATTLDHATQHYTKLHSHDTVVLHDSIYRHDSIIYRERTVHDTVYITKEVYRDRLEARGERLKAMKTDTVVVTEWRERVIELPPERYVPKFYRWCTIALWAIIAIAIIVVIGRLRL